MLEDLRAYYRKNGISAEEFHCLHAQPGPNSCRSTSHDFVSAREAFVGSEYEKGTLPRVLFVSLDASSVHPGRHASKRTLEHMRYWEENGKRGPDGCDPDRLPKNLHWYRTHEFAFRVLEPFAKARGLTPFLLRDVHRYFAHTNSAKCKDAARERSQGPALVFNNCRKYLAPEVELLRPDVLVTQGEWGHRAVADRFTVLRLVVRRGRPEHQCEILTIGNSPVLRFSLFHPRAFGLFNEQRREAYGWYFLVAQAFLSGGPEAVASVGGEA